MAHEQKELDNLEAVRAWKEAYKRGPAEFIKHYTDDFVIWTPLNDMTITAADKHRFVEGESAMQAAFEEIHLDVVNLHADGDEVFVDQILHGTWKDGRKHKQHIFSILTVRDGKIAKDVTYCNMVEGFDVDAYGSQA